MGWPAKKNAAFTVSFSIYDNDGDVVTGAASLDSEVSVDGGGYTDCTNEAVEDGTSGTYDLLLTSDEMNGNIIKVITKTTTPNAKTAVNIIYPEVVTIGELGTKIDTIDDFLDTEIAAILADTNELQTDWVNGGRLDLLVDAIKAKTDNLPSDPADESLLEAAITAATSGLATAANLATLTGYVDTEVAAILADTNELQTDWTNGGRLDLLIDAIKGKTDNLPTDPADESLLEAAITSATSGLATAANLATLAGYVDTEVAAILADTNELQTDLTNGGRLDLLIDAIKAKTDNLPATPAATGDAMTLASNAISSTVLATSAINAIADGILSRDIDQVEATAALHSLTTAILKAVSRVIDDAGTLKVYRTDGTTIHMSQTLTTDANNEPIDSVGVGS